MVQCFYLFEDPFPITGAFVGIWENQNFAALERDLELNEKRVFLRFVACRCCDPLQHGVENREGPGRGGGGCDGQGMHVIIVLSQPQPPCASSHSLTNVAFSGFGSSPCHQLGSGVTVPDSRDDPSAHKTGQYLPSTGRVANAVVWWRPRILASSMF